MRFLISLFVFCTPFSVYGQIIFEKTFGNVTCYEEGLSGIEVDENVFLISSFYRCPPEPIFSNLFFIDEVGDTLSTNPAAEINGRVHKAGQSLWFAGGSSPGFVYDSVVIVKTDINLNIEQRWAFQISACNNTAYNISSNNSGDIIITGIFVPNPCQNTIFDAFIAKIDTQTNQLTIYTVEDDLRDIQLFKTLPAPDGGYVAAGWTNKAGFPQQLLVKLNEQFDTLWTRTFGTANIQYAYSFTFDSDSGILLSGYSDSIEILKTDTSGKIIWRKTYGEACGGTDFQIESTQDNGYILLAHELVNGQCSSSLFKLRKNGDVFWKKTFNGRFRQVVELSDSSFLLTGLTGLIPDVYVVRFDSSLIIPDTTDAVFNLNPDFEISLYPNPADAFIAVEISSLKSPLQLILTDVFGRNHGEKSVKTPGKVMIEKPASAGIYFLTVRSEIGIKTYKIIFR